MNDINQMKQLKEYSEMCDIVDNISKLNIGEQHLYNKQGFDISNQQQFNNELENYYIIHYDENHTDFDKIINNCDLTKYTVQFSEYFTTILNSYFMDVMMKYMHIDVDEKANLTRLIQFYHFSIDYTSSYNKYKETLNSLNQNQNQRNEYEQQAKQELHDKLEYNKLIDIRDFTKDLLEDVNFNLSYKDYEDFTKKSYILLEPMHTLIQYVYRNSNDYIANPIRIEQMNLNDKIDIVIPLMNIVKFIIYILIKNEVL